MAKGSSKGGGSAYKQAANYVKENGIPAWFTNQGEQATKDVYRAISEYGKLNKEEQKLYDSIRYNKDEGILWFSGATRNVKGYTEKEIDGAKKFTAHAAYVGRKNNKR